MKKRFIVILAASLILALGVGTAAAASLTVSPSLVMFAPTPVGSISYQEVTIRNNGTETEYLVGAAPSEAPLWATWGGTCNVVYGNSVPADGSCTFQWGFKPDRPGMQAATGTISFESGATLNVTLIGRGTPH